MSEVIIYLRTSTEEQNPENQLADCQKVNSYGEAEVIEDKQSAWKEVDRPGFEKMKSLVVKQKVKHIIVWDFDRLFRNRKRFIEFLQLLKAFKVQLHSVRQKWIEEINKAPAPWNEIVYDLIIQVLGWLAEEESEKKSERIKIAFANHKGDKWGRPGISEKTRLEVVKLYRSGKSVREIAKVVTYWDKSRHQKNISVGAVHKIITDLPEKKSAQGTKSASIPFLNVSRKLKGGDANEQRTS